MRTQAIYRAMVLLLSMLLVACSGSAGGSEHTLSARTMEAATNIVPTAEAVGTETAAVGATPTADVEKGETATEYGSRLAPASGLRSDCINWPDEEISETNSAGQLTVSRSEGEPAVDFTLRDANGTPHSLAGLLESKPVLLVFGGFT